MLCVRGEIFDVGVDLRPQSPTYRQWVGVHLSDQNHCQLWLPQGFAHGFLTLSEQAAVLYKASDFWQRESERSIRWSDPQLQIAWPLHGLGVCGRTHMRGKFSPALSLFQFDVGVSGCSPA